MSNSFLNSPTCIPPKSKARWFHYFNSILAKPVYLLRKWPQLERALWNKVQLNAATLNLLKTDSVIYMHSDIKRILCIRKEQKGVADGQWHSAEMDSASSIATISVAVAVVTFLPWLALNWIYSQQLASEVLMCIFLIGKDVCQVRIVNTPNKSFNLTIFIQNTRLKILQAGQILHNLFSKDFDHESVSFPVLALFKEKVFFSPFEGKRLWQIVLIMHTTSMKGAHLCLQRQPGWVTLWRRVRTCLE